MQLAKIKVRTEALYYTCVILISFVMCNYRMCGKLCNNVFGFDRLVTFNVTKPFVYRALVPALVSFISKVLNLNRDMLFIYTELVACILIIELFRRYLKYFIESDLLTKILSFSIVLVLPFEMLLPRFTPRWYCWDLPSIAFVIGGLMLLYKQRWLPYYILFIFATFNRETSCFLTMVMVFTLWGTKSKLFIIKHAVLQLILWLAIKSYLHYLFVAQQGDVYQHQYLSNMNFFFSYYELWDIIYKYSSLLSNFCFVWVLPVVYYKLIPSLFLRRTIWVLIPFFLSMAYVANLYEQRIYGEMIPIVLAPAVVVLVELIKRESPLPTTVLAESKATHT